MLRLPSLSSLGLIIPPPPSFADGAGAGNGRNAHAPSRFSPPLIPVPSPGLSVKGFSLRLRGAQACRLPVGLLARKLRDLRTTEGLGEGHVVRRVARGLNGELRGSELVFERLG